MNTRQNKNSSVLRKAIILAGGWGTRFLPFTKVVPKEMLPIDSVPAIQHVVEECLSARIEEITVVTRPGCDITRRHFEAAPLMERYLTQTGQWERRRAIDQSAMVHRVTFVEEQFADVYGSAVPLLQLGSQLVDEPAFAVAFADDVILGQSAIAELARAFDQQDAKAAVALQKIPRHRLGQFGNVALGETLSEHSPRQFIVRDLTQRPAPDQIRSPYAVVSRLILTPAILDHFVPPAPNGEMDIGAAVARLARVARVVGVEISGQWVTVGDPVSYLQALQIASRTTKEGKMHAH